MSTENIDPEIFEQAAELIDSGQELYACHAISEAGFRLYYDNTPETQYFRDVLKPRNATEAGDAIRERFGDDRQFTFWNCSQFYGDTTKQNQEARILGLLLCAELAREGFEP